MKSCFHEDTTDDGTDMNSSTNVLNKTKIDGIDFKTCEQIGIEHSIQGEHKVFPCHGHFIDVYPNKTTPLQFKN